MRRGNPTVGGTCQSRRTIKTRGQRERADGHRDVRGTRLWEDIVDFDGPAGGRPEYRPEGDRPGTRRHGWTSKISEDTAEVVKGQKRTCRPLNRPSRGQYPGLHPSLPRKWRNHKNYIHHCVAHDKALSIWMNILEAYSLCPMCL